MGLTRSKGNMYDWVTHVHSHLAGECPHKCTYCYVQRGMARMSGRYKGNVRLVEEELDVNYGSGKIIFIEHMNDLFAEEISGSWIGSILRHCREYPYSRYVFQTKNPQRAWRRRDEIPYGSLIGTTIESNRIYPSISKAMDPEWRMRWMNKIRSSKFHIFVTIEPIMDFDVDVLVSWIKHLRPVFVNIGADSKKANLPEPNPQKIKDLVAGIEKLGIPIKKKVNLERLLGDKGTTIINLIFILAAALLILGALAGCSNDLNWTGY